MLMKKLCLFIGLILISLLGIAQVTSNSATLTLGTLPVITTQPVSQVACLGAPASFTIVATGTAPLSYQWRKGSTNISGATNSTYTIDSVKVSDGNTGSYSCVVICSCGSVTSNSVGLTVNLPPVITVQPANLNLCPGTMAVFSVTATGTGLTYQWRKNGTNLTGATSTNLIFMSINASSAGTYDVIVGGTCQ